MTENDDPNSSSELLENHGDYLFRFAMSKIQDVHIAEELVQETLVKAIKSVHQFRGDSALRTWLTQILCNEIAGHFRTQAKRDRMHVELAEPGTAELSRLLNPKISVSDFNSTVERDEFWAVIQDCFSRLPEHLLETFLAKWKNDGQKTEVLCKELGIKPSNFAVRMFRTRLLLRDCIESNWFEIE